MPSELMLMLTFHQTRIALKAKNQLKLIPAMKETTCINKLHSADLP